jgi:hypothetical protein
VLGAPASCVTVCHVGQLLVRQNRAVLLQQCAHAILNVARLDGYTSVLAVQVNGRAVTVSLGDLKIEHHSGFGSAACSTLSP